MSRFNKLTAIMIILEIIVVLAGNYYCISTYDNNDNKLYRVEVKRMINDIEKGTAVQKNNASESPEYAVDQTLYPHIISVRLFDPNDKNSNPYTVESVRGKLYRFDYKTDISYAPIIYMNVVFGFMLVFTIFIFIYIRKSIIKPFASMESLTEELAKGNLSKPVKEEKSKLFGKFLWSMDMLREKLEQEKEKEMAYMKERKTLMLSLSHDIKTPLAAIDLYTKALSSGLYDTDEKKEEAYNGIEKNLKELSNYIEEITAASRDDFLMLEVKDDEVYLGNVLTRIEEYYNEKFSRLHTEFTINKYDDMLIRGDEDRLVEVMQNVLENAIKYGDGRKVEVLFSEEEDAKLIHIRNTGEAPAEAEMIHLFDSFYRGSNSEKQKGSGLGLYISRQLMKRMDGDIYATRSDDGFEAVIVAMKA